MKRIVTLLIISCLFCLSSCDTRKENATTLVRNAGWQWNIVPSEPFDLATATPVGRKGEYLWVYIEGDGRAFLTPTRVSSDPTPTDPIALRLALTDARKTPVAYVGRPCQYVLPTHGRGCKADYWTDARYAPEVITSLNKAIDTLKAQAGSAHVILVGYSGGGALAVLLAAKRHDVSGIITVVADLDTAYWTKRDGLTPLSGSLDPADSAQAVAAIAQIHFTGAEDKVVGTDAVRAFTHRLPAGSPAQVKEIPGFNHSCCWVDKWNQLIGGVAVDF